jgi:hypothetical protein
MYQISHSILIIRLSFLFWCLIGCFFIGFDHIWIGILFSVFIYRVNFENHFVNQNLTKNVLLSILFIIIIFNVFNFSSIYRNNMFFSDAAVEKVVEVANANVGKGRSIFELLATSLVILPFILVDNIAKFSGRLKYFVLLNLLVYFLIISGSSRGMLSLILIAIGLPLLKKFKFALLLLIPFIFLYIKISLLRDGEVNYLLGPFLDSFAIPGYLLGLLNDLQIQRNALDYILDVFLKFVPSFIYEKNIFSFNIEMTKQIYPFMEDEVSAISVFTYIGEMLIYKPVLITVVFSILFVRTILKFLMMIFFRYSLKSTSLFVSIYFFIVLRSRVPDLISMLLLNLMVLGIIHLCNNLKATQEQE